MYLTILKESSPRISTYWSRQMVTTAPPTMTNFAIGDINHHMAFAQNIDKCPFQDALLVFLFIVLQIRY